MTTPTHREEKNVPNPRYKIGDVIIWDNLQWSIGGARFLGEWEYTLDSRAYGVGVGQLVLLETQLPPKLL